METEPATMLLGMFQYWHSLAGPLVVGYSISTDISVLSFIKKYQSSLFLSVTLVEVGLLRHQGSRSRYPACYSLSHPTPASSPKLGMVESGGSGDRKLNCTHTD